jgi:hypothetical protein
LLLPTCLHRAGELSAKWHNHSSEDKMIYTDFENIPFHNHAAERLKQTYAVLYYLCNGDSPRNAISKASDYFPQIHDRGQTVESKISTQINVRLGTFFEWFDNDTIFPELVSRLGLDEHDQEIFRELLDFEDFYTFHIPEEIHESIDNIFEGAVKEIRINVYERNAKARKICAQNYGFLCSVCECKLSDTYGEIGEGYIHVHHIRPLSEIGEEYELNPIEDLRPICPNCHAMIHTQTPPYTIEQMKEIIQNAT